MEKRIKFIKFSGVEVTDEIKKQILNYLVDVKDISKSKIKKYEWVFIEQTEKNLFIHCGFKKLNKQKEQVSVMVYHKTPRLDIIKFN